MMARSTLCATVLAVLFAAALAARKDHALQWVQVVPSRTGGDCVKVSGKGRGRGPVVLPALPCVAWDVLPTLRAHTPSVC